MKTNIFVFIKHNTNGNACAAFRIMRTIHEPAREIPVVGDFDIRVGGGSCTGVFAATRAAGFGARVAPVENKGGSALV